VREKAGVSPVEGVKFADDTDDHRGAPFVFYYFTGKEGKMQLDILPPGYLQWRKREK
jgi:hypothetical protein